MENLAGMVLDGLHHLPARYRCSRRNERSRGPFHGRHCGHGFQSAQNSRKRHPESPDTFDSIELQRGPASVLYPNYLSMDFSGNQSPLTGTTNILLKERIDRQMTRAELFYGSYDTFGGRAFHQQAADNLHFFFGGEYEQSDYTDYGTADSWLNMLDDPEYDKTKFYAKTTLFLNEAQDHKLSLFFNRTGHQGDTGRQTCPSPWITWTMHF